MKMKRICPRCNAKLKSDATICPLCNYNLDEISKDIEESNSKQYQTRTDDVFKCPFCNKSISEYHEKCPHCSADLLIEKLEQTRVEIGALEVLISQEFTCPSCQEIVPAGSNHCPSCNMMFQDDRPNANIFSDAVPSSEEQFTQDTDKVIVKEEAELRDIIKEQEEKRKVTQRQDQLQSDKKTSVKSVVGTLDKNILAGIGQISPDEAPKAALSLEDETLYYLIAGMTLTLGRHVDTCHVPAILFPDQTYHEQNINVSRDHCHIYIRENKVWIKDLSSNGTFIMDKRIPSDQEVPLEHNEKIRIADVLTLNAQIYTEDNTVIAVKLERLENSSNEKYILCPGLIPFGSCPEFPIHMKDVDQYCGAFFYNPLLKSWCLRCPEDSPETIEDTILDPVQDLVYGNHLIWFSVIS